MTNEEKILELHPIRIIYSDEVQEEYDCNAAERLAALEMARWKDQQLKEYLEFQKIECLRTAKIVYAYDMSSAGELKIKAKCYDEIINELFGGE